MEQEVGDTGSTVGAHLRQVAKARGVDVSTLVAKSNGEDESQAPEEQPPFELAWLWETFLELNQSRQSGMGINPISFAEIEAWCRLYRTRLRPWEVDVIRRLDAVVIELANDRSRKTRTEDRKPRSGRRK